VNLVSSPIDEWGLVVNQRIRFCRLIVLSLINESAFVADRTLS